MGALARLVAAFGEDVAKQFLNILIIGSALATVIIGTSGWILVFSAVDAEGASAIGMFFDALYRALLAFTLSEIYAPGPQATLNDSHALGSCLLDVARFLGVFAIMAGLVRVLLSVGGRALDRIRATLMSDHIVVVGDGDTAREVASAFARTGAQTILHTRDRNPRRMDGVLLQPFEEELKSRWMQNSFSNARRIIIAEDSEPATSELALRVAARDYRKSEERAQACEVFAVLRDPWVSGNFRRILEHPGKSDPPCHLYSVSEAAGAAQAVLRRHPAFLLASQRGQRRAHVLIAGFGRLGEALLREVINRDVAHGLEPPLVTVIDDDAEASFDRLISRYPGLARLAPGAAPGAPLHEQQAIDAQVHLIKGRADALNPTAVERIKERIAHNSNARLTAIYVATARAGNPLAVAVGLQEISARDGWADAPVFLRSRTHAGLDAHPGGCANGLEGPVPFGGWEDMISAMGLLDDEPDRLARAVHDAYQSQAERSGTSGAPVVKSAADRAWAMLPERFRSSNQRAVGHIPAKLWSLGFDITPLCQASPLGGEPQIRLAGDEPLFRTAGELVAMAALEHERWVADRKIDGWRYGKTRDNDARLHPYMIGFEELEDHVKAFDFAILRHLKTLLTAAPGADPAPTLRRRPGSTPISIGAEEDALALVQRIDVADLLDHE